MIVTNGFCITYKDICNKGFCNFIGCKWGPFWFFAIRVTVSFIVIVFSIDYNSVQWESLHWLTTDKLFSSYSYFLYLKLLKKNKNIPRIVFTVYFQVYLHIEYNAL